MALIEMTGSADQKLTIAAENSCILGVKLRVCISKEIRKEILINMHDLKNSVHLDYFFKPLFRY